MHQKSKKEYKEHKRIALEPVLQLFCWLRIRIQPVAE